MVPLFQENLLSAGSGNSWEMGMGRDLLRREILIDGKEEFLTEFTE